MEFVETWWEHHVYAAGGVFNTMILLLMGANLIDFVLSVNGAQYFMHELIGSWNGMSHSEILLTLFSFIEIPQEFAFSSSHAHFYLLAYNPRSSIGMFAIRSRRSSADSVELNQGGRIASRDTTTMLGGCR
jgi:hypothetical protein